MYDWWERYKILFQSGESERKTSESLGGWLNFPWWVSLRFKVQTKESTFIFLPFAGLCLIKCALLSPELEITLLRNKDHVTVLVSFVLCLCRLSPVSGWGFQPQPRILVLEKFLLRIHGNSFFPVYKCKGFLYLILCKSVDISFWMSPWRQERRWESIIELDNWHKGVFNLRTGRFLDWPCLCAYCFV